MVKENRMASRLKRLRKRQPTSAWAENYKPGTKATRVEAPSISRPTIIYEKNKIGRELHAMSLTERDALLVALRYKNVIDINEQRVLHPFEGPHPLMGHPEAAGMQLKNLMGMVNAYDELGETKRYPIITVKNKNGEKVKVPNLMEGDLLLYLKDKAGLYCVNWTVKANEAQFDRTKLEGAPELDTKQDRQRAVVRHATEELYYKKSEIPTYRVTGDTFDPIYLANLRRCFLWRARIEDKHTQYIEKAALLLNSVLDGYDPLNELGHYFCRKNRIQDYDWKIIMHFIFWESRIPIDFTRHVLYDQPIRSLYPSNLKKYEWLFMRQMA